MYLALVFFVLFVPTMCFVFPEYILYWTQKIRAGLHRYMEHREQEEYTQLQFEQNMNEWNRVVNKLLKKIPKKALTSYEEMKLIQTLAAGQRFLASVREEQHPQLYRETETICRHIEQILNS